MEKLEKATKRRETKELKKVQKAKELYTKHFNGSPENPIYRERKTCSDIMIFQVQTKDQMMSEESKIKATQLLAKQERAAARREEREMKKVLKAKELYTKHFSGSPENPIYRERKTCSDVLFPEQN